MSPAQRVKIQATKMRVWIDYFHSHIFNLSCIYRCNLLCLDLATVQSLLVPTILLASCYTETKYWNRLKKLIVHREEQMNGHRSPYYRISPRSKVA